MFGDLHACCKHAKVCLMMTETRLDKTISKVKNSSALALKTWMDQMSQRACRCMTRSNLTASTMETEVWSSDKFGILNESLW